MSVFLREVVSRGDFQICTKNVCYLLLHIYFGYFCCAVCCLLLSRNELPSIHTFTMGLCNSCLSEEERDAAREIVRQLREKVLCGDFVCAKNILEKWMKPHDVLVISFLLLLQTP